VTIVLAVCALVASLVALVARRIEYMAIALGVVGGVLSLDLMARDATTAAVVMMAGTSLLVMVVLVAVALVEVDARPARRLRPWKLLLLAPLVVVLSRVDGSLVQSSSARPTRALAGAVIVVGLLSLAPSLLVRRRQGGVEDAG
jgi:hypothetical protein